MSLTRAQSEAVVVAVAVAAAVVALLVGAQLGLGFEGVPERVVVGAPERLFEVADRRGPVVGVTLLVWLGALAVAMLVGGARPRRGAARLFALALAYLPLLLLAGAALEPGVGAERALVMIGGPALGALTLATVGAWGTRGDSRDELRLGYRALAVACAASVLASAADVVAGSSLTQLSLAGPNPAAGHRFYGVGNELEAIMLVLIPVGTGAALAGFAGSRPAPAAQPTFSPPGRGQSRMRGALAFLATAVLFSFVFAYGRFGADVGAAIAPPIGGAVAAALLLERPRWAWLALLLPLPALALLIAVDLATGSEAHLTGTVLATGGGGDALGVVGHRLREAGESFGRPLLLPGLPVLVVAAIVVWRGRARIAAWLAPIPPVRAALLGALAAVLAGTVGNDSGALLLEIGSAYLLATLGFAYAEGSRGDIDYP